MIAKKGSGKMAAYLIALIKHLTWNKHHDSAYVPHVGATQKDLAITYPAVLILLPTREMAIRAFRKAVNLTKSTDIRPAILYGGTSMRDQQRVLLQGCDILVATPGRLLHVLKNRMVVKVAGGESSTGPIRDYRRVLNLEKLKC